MKPENTQWRHWLNPCDIDRAKILAPVGDLMDRVASECNCCNTGRVVVAAAISAVFFFILGKLL